MTAPPRTLAYLDCFSGISGDMFLAALLDAGLAPEALQEQLALLPLSGWELCQEKSCRNHIAATAITVRVGTDQPHRCLADIRRLIARSALAPAVQETIVAVFSRLARAEAAVHGIGEEEVHFHEVGGVDAIIDIAGVVIGLSCLGVGALHCSPLPMPRGWTDCAHGRLPLPAPAVCELLKGVPVCGSEGQRELVTPTGAALVAELCTTFGPLPPMRMAAVGYGAGRHQAGERETPNLLRLILGQPVSVAEAQEVEIIETHLDDWAPETFPYLTERLLALGALDVALAPVQMKKGRPGFALRVVADPACALTVKQCLLSETTAIGLRFHNEQRWTLPRRSGTVASPWGRLTVKRVSTPKGEVLTPEYEECRRVALQQGIPIREVYAAVGRAGLEDFQEEEP
jgi:pyridinium-3,5-bisthiocarboxylic acid mononucleotide nickel chelatase